MSPTFLQSEDINVKTFEWIYFSEQTPFSNNVCMYVPKRDSFFACFLISDHIPLYFRKMAKIFNVKFTFKPNVMLIFRWQPDTFRHFLKGYQYAFFPCQVRPCLEFLCILELVHRWKEELLYTHHTTLCKSW